MKNKDKFQLFLSYLEEEITLKRALESKSNVVLTLLVVLITGIFLNINNIIGLIQPSIKIYLMILLIIELFTIIFCLFSALTVFSNKAFSKSIPDNYFKLLLLESNKDEEEIYNDLVYDLNTKIETNALLNLIKAGWLNRAQKMLALAYVLMFVIILLVLISNVPKGA